MNILFEDAKILKEELVREVPKKTKNAWQNTKQKFHVFSQTRNGSRVVQAGSALIGIAEVITIIYLSVLMVRIAQRTVDGIVPPKQYPLL